MALEFWKEKMGPMPRWAWAAILLGVLVAVSSWRRNKAAGEEQDTATSSSAGIELPGDVAPTYVFQNYDQDVTTVNTAPAGGGRPPVTTLPAPVPVTPKPTTPKPTTPTRPSPKPPAGKFVTVTKWNSTKAPWNSTIWGITTKLLGPKAQWQSVWNAPQNAALKAKRKDPKKIQPGDKVWVPGAK